MHLSATTSTKRSKSIDFRAFEPVADMATKIGVFEMYFTYAEKIEYINQDFKQSALYLLGEVPSTKAEQREFFHKAIAYAGDFIEKYAGRGRNIKEYIKIFIDDYMETLEREAKRKRECS